MTDNPNTFYALNLRGCQQLANSNTLICDGPHGRFFEVTMEKEVIWENKNQIQLIFMRLRDNAMVFTILYQNLINFCIKRIIIELL